MFGVDCGVVELESNCDVDTSIDGAIEVHGMRG